MRESILNMLKNGSDTTLGFSTEYLARTLGYPAASIRRGIGELRFMGHNIVREGKRYVLKGQAEEAAV